MTVTRETRSDMASAWVRELAREEIRQMLAPVRLELNHAVLELKKAVAEVAGSQDKLRDDFRDLNRRAGEFTGLSEVQVSRLVSATVTGRVTRMTIDEMFEDVIRKYYGSARHPSFRERFRLDDPRLRKHLEGQDESSQGSD